MKIRVVVRIEAGSTYTYCYDPNGNMVKRTIGGTAYTLSYNAENRLTGVSGGTTATYVYDGDGNRVKGTVGGTTTAYVGNYFEWTGATSTMVQYYYAGSQRVAMRTGTGGGSTLRYLFNDHLGGTNITATAAGGFYGSQRYYPWGESRYVGGSGIPTTFRYTGQRSSHWEGPMDCTTTGQDGTILAGTFRAGGYGGAGDGKRDRLG